MADTTVLRCWPACVEAIDWSSDGIIALASDERVELLFPNTVDFERNQILPQWQHVALKVPSFSTDELPFKEPAPAQNYSVGEEISNNAPINIAWSPPGLAKHRRCGLAALTTGLILSIWSDEGRPQEESSWARRLIVNDALMQYFTEYDEEPSHLTMRPKEQLRLRSRIRAFAWAPALPCPEPAGVIGTRLFKARVWGLTISPLGDYIAACNTVHPSDMIEYGIPADRRVTVAISSLRCSTQQRDVFTKDMVSAEGVLHTLKKLAENTVEDPDELSTFAEDIVKELLEAYTAPVISEDNTNTSNLDANSSDINVLITIFKKVAFLNSETLEDRYTILVAHACRAGSSIDLQKTLIAYRLAGALQHLPPSLSNTPFSSEIRAQHRQLIALIDTIMARGDAPEVSAIDDEASNDPSDGDSAPTNPTVPIIYQDTCDICSAPIPFTDLNTATCTNGHEPRAAD
ncbi:TFIIIC-delta multi-domain protein [Pyrenophora tritici-repentis]|nr:TFIIIC-delta multi-domain protein [Pyrenophora tritici-repentis]